MSQTMVERVAKVLYAADNPFGEWDTTLLQNTYKIAAKASIMAMREPTEEMLVAGKAQEIPGYEYNENGDPIDVYRAMIDAALK